MLVLVVSLAEFLQFMKLIMWICIPLFLITTAIVTWWHYRAKRRQSMINPDGLQLAAALPVDALRQSNLLYPPPQQSLRETYRLQWEAGKEQFQMLKSDFNFMKDEYAALQAGSGGNGSVSDEQASNEMQKKFKQYELKIAQMQQALDFLQSNAGTEENIREAQTILSKKDEEIKRLQLISEQLHKEIGLLRQQNDSGNNEIQKLNHQLKELQESARRATTEARDLQNAFQQQTADKDSFHFKENNRLTEEIKQLHEACKKLEEENRRLQQSMQENRQDQQHDHEKRIGELQGILMKTEQELQELKNKLADAGSMEQIADERKLQIEFLQNQLDQRIRNNHQLEMRGQESEAKILQLQEELSGYKNHAEHIKQETDKLRETSESLKLQAETAQSVQTQLEQLLQDKQKEFTLFEQTRHQQESLMQELQQELLRNNTIINNLETQLSASRQEMLSIESNLQHRQQLLLRIHQELGAGLESPVGDKE